MKKALTNCILIFSIALALFSCKKSVGDNNTSSSTSYTKYKYYFTYTLNGSTYGYGSNNWDGILHNIEYGFDANAGNTTGGIVAEWTDDTYLITYSAMLMFDLPLKVGTLTCNNDNASSIVNFPYLILSNTQGDEYYSKNTTFNITKVGGTGGLIQGNFSGTFEYNIDANNQTYQTANITGSFSVYRQY